MTQRPRECTSCQMLRSVGTCLCDISALSPLVLIHLSFFESRPSNTSHALPDLRCGGRGASGHFPLVNRHFPMQRTRSQMWWVRGCATLPLLLRGFYPNERDYRQLLLRCGPACSPTLRWDAIFPSRRLQLTSSYAEEPVESRGEWDFAHMCG